MLQKLSWLDLEVVKHLTMRPRPYKNFLYLDNLVGYHTTTDGLDFRDPDISQSTVLIENRMQSWRLPPLLFSQDSNL